LYYNFSKLPYQANAIAELEVAFKDTKDTLLKARLNPVLASEIFTKLKKGNEFDNVFNFRKYIPGVAIVPRAGDNTTTGFSLVGNTGITFHYHLAGDTKKLTYKITTFSSRSFNGI
jgi:hypothetical protein